MKDSGWFLIVIAFLLGIRHGFDLDHLATIDSITRTVSDNRYLSRIIGFLFSLGHGLVVILISLIIGSGLKPSAVPEWLNWVGDIISISFLFLFGLSNLWNIVQHPSKKSLPTSFKSYLSGKLIHKNFNPVCIIFIGVLFALSFDTVSQVVLFSLSASALAGCLFSVVLGVVFMLGMMMSDGLNGLFVSILIQRADRVSFLFSRIAGLMIASFSLIIGIINCFKMFNYA
ncbi:high-affinity nickel-transport protein [Legionella birminghamensis]|uniref:Nickel/cobalt efflux system n=1 Tax=Legionella birminghamensis TaxID=28083 RepID=A0A378IAF3_9GAMM|nr:DNA repair protein [Legionella birminghamensis]KTC74861.1 high-affinity nickel-transport protein [Legionella birminghamensis]STX31762.1 high-affinity nickel-transport protein [Legionella birminghamensis]